MAAAIKALNARIRSNPALDYFCSTHFWGPASNFGIPIAAVMDTQKDPEIISGKMTTALLGYSTVFMRYSMMVTPKNYLLFAMHFVNFGAQSTQMYRFIDYWHMGGKDKALQARAKEGLSNAEDGAKKVADQVKDKAAELTDQAKKQIDKVTR